MSYDTAMLKIKGLTLWPVLLIFSAFMQLLRDAYVDGLIYLIAAIVCVLLENKAIESLFVRLRIILAKSFHLVYICAFSSLLFIDVHTRPALFIFILLTPALILVGPQKYIETQNQKAFTRSKYILLGLAIALGLTETGSFLISVTGINDRDFPTISLILDPTLHHDVGRALLLIPFIYVGYFLLFSKEKN